MSEYFPIEPLGLASAYGESFSSYCCRLAAAHSLSTGTLITHLRLWWKRTTGEDGVLKTTRGINQSWNSYSPTASQIRRVIEKATSVRDLDRTSLAALEPAAPANCLGLLRGARAWCPACMADSSSGEQYYDRLLWVMPNIVRCPEHQVRLQNACPLCESVQRRYHFTGDMTRCWKCSGSLVQKPMLWSYESKPSLCEAGVVDLAREISASGLVVVDGAFQKFAHEIRSALPGKRRGYAFIFGSKFYSHVRRERMPPTFTSMLQQSQALGVPLVHILTDPTGAARFAGELALSGHIAHAKTKSRISKKTIGAIRAKIVRALDATGDVEMASFRALAREFNVLSGTIEYHAGELASKYKAKRKEVVTLRAQKKWQRVLEVLDGGLSEDYRSRKIRSIDDLARRVDEASGCGIRTARRAIAERLTVSPCYARRQLPLA